MTDQAAHDLRIRMRAFEWLERQVDLHGIRIRVPRKASLEPEPARLQARYERFLERSVG